MTRNLTEKDRKVLKNEKRIGIAFGCLIISIGGLFNLFYFVLNKTRLDYFLLILIDVGVLILAYFVCNRVNLKVNLDLKENIKELIKRSIEKKIEEKSSQAGSGALYIPILGDLFPKLWGQKMRETSRYFIYTHDNKFEVEKDVYDNFRKNTDIYIHIAKHSETVLNFSKEE